MVPSCAVANAPGVKIEPLVSRQSKWTSGWSAARGSDSAISHYLQPFGFVLPTLGTGLLELKAFLALFRKTSRRSGPPFRRSCSTSGSWHPGAFHLFANQAHLLAVVRPRKFLYVGPSYVR